MSSAASTVNELRLTQAAEWLQQLEAAPRDEGLLSRWLEWCQADVRNLEAFESLQSVWSAFDEPEVRSAAERARTPKRGFWRRPMTALAASVAALGLCVSVVGRDTLMGWIDPAREVLTTEVAEHGNQLLADGSRVELGGKTRIVTRYSDHERSVVVESGEAFFAVTKDPQRPFVVQAGGVQVTAVGTAFSVRRTMDRTVVAVSEGVVRVAPSSAAVGHQVQLVAGEQVSFSAASNKLNIVRIDPKVTESRLDGALSFESEPLRSVIADVNRYAARRIVLDDAALGDRTFTGTVYQDRIDDWLRALEAVFPLTVVDNGASIELRPRGATAGD
ncbi:FecR family protein [Peristeroidobacter soli]|jgi:transmembrane sensor|uniref:FecR family protein n=1 Tax=Peristeroidobacter soli TaxID=2497877 RepID=UPI00101D601A|nr:FecR domain-containing protein [Peristeroidobacter soli]